MGNSLSVIIPTKNRLDEIKICLSSLVNKKFINEIIIVNNSFKEYNNDEQYLQLKKLFSYSFINVIDISVDKDSSVSENRLIGLENSNSEYILFLDDDSFVGKEFSNWFKYLGNNPFLAIGVQDVENTGNFSDWSFYPDEFSPLRLRREDFFIHYDIMLFRRYIGEYLVKVPYSSGIVIGKKKDFIEGYKEAVKLFNKGVPREDVFVSVYLVNKYKKLGVFYTPYYIFHFRLKQSYRNWKLSNKIPERLRELVKYSEELYEDLYFIK